MPRGKRYDGEPKLNKKKVFGVILAFLVLVIIIISIVKILKNDKTENIPEEKQYFSVYTDGKWGVIDQDGKFVIEAKYDEMVVVPDSKKAVFITTYDVDDTLGTYKTSAIDDNGQMLFTDYEKVEAIDNYDSKQNIWFEKNVLRVSKEGKYGLIDFEGNVLLDCDYDKIESLKGVEENFVISRNGKVGLVNSKGQIVINTDYIQILVMKEGYKDEYIVKNESGKYGVVTTSGTAILPLEYEAVKYLGTSDIYAAKKDGVWNLVDKNKQVVLTAANGEKYVYAKGENVIFSKDGKYGVKSLTGDSIINPTYDYLEYTFSVYYIAKKDGKFGIINVNNEEVKPFEYSNMYYIDEGKILVADKTETETVILDNNLAEKLSGIVSEIDIEKGYIKIYDGNEYKYYNFKFEEKLSADLLTENSLYLSKKDGKYGYVDKSGNVKIDYIYEDATEQNSLGFAAVKQNGVWGSIDKIGKIVLEPSVNLDNTIYIDFIGVWHLSDDGLYYTK